MERERGGKRNVWRERGEDTKVWGERADEREVWRELCVGELYSGSDSSLLSGHVLIT